MAQLTADIGDKRKILKGDLNELQMLQDEYERDHEMGEGLHSQVGAATLADKEAHQEREDLKIESGVVEATHTMAHELTQMHMDTQNSMMRSAKALIGIHDGSDKELGENAEVSATDTDSVEGAALGQSQIKLAAKIAMAKTALQLKLSKFDALRQREKDLISQAKHLHRAALGARSGEYDEQTRTSAMQNIVKDLDRGVERHEESMELGETLFRKEKSEMEEGDLGESSSSDDSAGLPPIQAEINFEHQKLAQAEAEIRHLAQDGPKIVKEQIAVDKKRYGKGLKIANAKLNALHKRFARAAKQLSPKLTSQVALDDAKRDEESRQEDYAHDLDNVSAYANMVDVKAKESEDAARALDKEDERKLAEMQQAKAKPVETV